MTLSPKTKVPEGTNVVFQESSFFERHAALPTPEEVRTRAEAALGPRRNIVIFHELDLVVKFGGWQASSVSEGQCLYVIRNALGGCVPVPEVFGWAQDAGEVFIYMELVQGVTLQSRWESLNEHQRTMVCRELRMITKRLQELEQDDPAGTFIGQIDRSSLQDISLPVDCISRDGTPSAGPFASVQAFHDWFSCLYKRIYSDPHSIPDDGYRGGLPDAIPINFTHGDLHPSNIIISATGMPHVVSIVDWHQAGWLPAYWEARKATYTVPYDGEWALKYLPMFLDMWQGTADSWYFYVDATGN